MDRAATGRAEVSFEDAPDAVAAQATGLSYPLRHHSPLTPRTSLKNPCMPWIPWTGRPVLWSPEACHVCDHSGDRLGPVQQRPVLVRAREPSRGVRRRSFDADA